MGVVLAAESIAGAFEAATSIQLGHVEAFEGIKGGRDTHEASSKSSHASGMLYRGLGKLSS